MKISICKGSTINELEGLAETKSEMNFFFLVEASPNFFPWKGLVHFFPGGWSLRFVSRRKAFEIF